MMGMSRAVFLSYASQDAEAARRICDALRAAGIGVWFDQSELRGGDAWDASIRKHIKTCALFIPVISRNTHAREEGYFRLEWKLAVDRSHLMTNSKTFLLPVVIDDTRDDDEQVPDKFRELQWSRLSGGETSLAFVERVTRLLSPEPSHAPAEVRSPAAAAAPPTAAAPRQPAPGPAASRRSMSVPLLIALGVAVIGVGYLALDKFVLSKHVTAPVTPATPGLAATSAIAEKSVAVLPFVDMSEKKDQQYFSDGLSEELIDQLSHIPDLKVIARTSSFAFKGKNEDMRSIAAKLGVAKLLEGSVRKAGTELRITAQLIRASDGAHLWSQTYERKLTDIFKVQEEISRTVAQALSATLTAGPSRAVGRELNLEAYDLLLKGNYFHERQHMGDEDLAIDQYKRALQLDPNYALAWAQLARVYVVQGSTVEHPASEAESEAREALQHALAIDPNLTAAHHWLGRIYLNYDLDWAAAKQELERAIALDPNSPEGGYARSDLLALTAFTTGRFEDSIRNEQRNLARNPIDTGVLFLLSWMPIFSGQLDAAATNQRRLFELDPAYGGDMHGNAAFTRLLMGKYVEALTEANQETDEESRLENAALIYWAMGRKGDSDAALGQLQSKFAKTAAYDVGAAHAYRGEADAAVTWLERAYSQRDGSLILLKVDPRLRYLHGDSRYNALMRKLKFPES